MAGLRGTALALCVLLIAGGCAVEPRADSGTAADGALAADGSVVLEGRSAGEPPDALALNGPRPQRVVVGHATVGSITAHERPNETSPAIASLANPTPIGGPLAFQLVDAEVPDGLWAEVFLPVRPNGTTGWVRVAELELTSNPYRIEIDRGDHTLAVYRDGERWLATTVAIGTGETPTPVGQFYIIELLQPPAADGVYGPFAFGLSGFSETLEEFAGGEGVIGIHGTNEPGSIGQDVSHGCIRVDNDVIRELAGIIPLGTPVVIT